MNHAEKWTNAKTHLNECLEHLVGPLPESEQSDYKLSMALHMVREAKEAIHITPARVREFNKRLDHLANSISEVKEILSVLEGDAGHELNKLLPKEVIHGCSAALDSIIQAEEKIMILQDTVDGLQATMEESS